MIRLHYEKFLLVGILLIIALSANQAVDPGPRVTAEEGPPASLLANAHETLASADRVDFQSGALSPLDSVRRSAFYRATSEMAPSIQAESAIVADLETGEIYFEINSDRHWPIASITKLMSAAHAERVLNSKTAVILRSEDFSSAGGDFGRTLKSGEVFSVRDLTKAMLLFSSNESAEAIANSYGRSQFLAGMNSLAAEWGLIETNFVDPTGLSPSNQSTARDLVRMTREILHNNPGVFATTRLPSADITELTTGRIAKIFSNNQFIGRDYFLGGKTGYTDEARSNLLSVFSYGDRPIVIVILGSYEDRFAETEKLRDWFIHSHKRNI